MGNEQIAGLLTAQTSLDFANTVSYRHSPQPQEQLPDYASLVQWAVQSGGLEELTAGKLNELAEANPELARQAYEQALDLRERIYRLLAALSMGSKTNPEDLQSFNLALGQAMAHARLAASEHAYKWSWETSQDLPLERVWWPAARSAAVLLSSPDLLDRLGRCADAQCGWLFLDTSKSRTRRWCDIGDCGNRAKQRRYQKKKRRESGEQATSH